MIRARLHALMLAWDAFRAVYHRSIWLAKSRRAMADPFGSEE